MLLTRIYMRKAGTNVTNHYLQMLQKLYVINYKHCEAIETTVCRKSKCLQHKHFYIYKHLYVSDDISNAVCYLRSKITRI